MKAYPTSSKNNQESDKNEGEEIEGFHRIFLDLELAVSLDIGGDIGDSLGIVMRKEFSCSHQHISYVRDIEGDTAVYHLSCAHGFNASQIFAELGPLDNIFFEAPVILEGEIGVEIGKEFFVFHKDNNFIQFVFGQFLPDKFPQEKPIFRKGKSISFDGVAQLLGIVKGDFFGIGIEAIGHTFRVIQYSVQGGSEPVFDIPADQIRGKEEKEKGRDEGEGDKKEDKLCLEVSSEDFSFSFQVELNQIPPQDKEEDEEKKKDDDLQGGKENVCQRGGRKLLRFTNKIFNGEKENNQK